MILRRHERAAHGRIELPADGQDRVADGLGLEPAPAEVRQETILRVDLGRPASGPSALLVG